MSEPMTGGAAKLIAEEMLKDVQEAAIEARREAEAQATQEGQFQETLHEVARTQDVQQVGQAQEATRPVDRIREAIESQRTAPAAPVAGQVNDTRPITQGMQRIFEDVMSGQNKLEQIIDLAVSGRNFSQNELLALQAGVYRFTQELELTSKVIEKGTSSIKQTLNTQV